MRPSSERLPGELDGGRVADPAGSGMVRRPLLTLSGVSKEFPGVRALRDVSLSLYPGEVTALVGENGAGKSTLVKILTGIVRPSAGTLEVDGVPVSLTSAQDAFARGITAIHQETVLFDDLSVTENILLGHAPRTRFRTIDRAASRQRARDVLASMGAAHIPVNAVLRDLGIANRHLVALARALSIDARIVIMDEPTAALSLKEIEELFALIDLLKRRGKAILFISHKFDEITRVADRYIVFRDGEMVGEGLMADASQDVLVRLMVDRAVDRIFPKRQANVGASVLNVADLSHPTEFDGIGFELRTGEILGFYGLVGAGRSETMQAIAGMSRTSRGTITIDGRPIAPRSAADAIAAGVVYVPEDRGRQGAVTGLPIFKNVSLPSLGRVSRHGLLQIAREFALARTYTERLDLRASSLSQDIATLSGGNQQKVIIARWLAAIPKIIILDEPTKGIDIGSKAAVHAFMADLVREGLSVIMVSSELPEILGMSDRVVVMREGRIVDTYVNRDLGPETLVRAAAGLAA